MNKNPVILLFSFSLIIWSTTDLFAQHTDTLKPKNVLILNAVEPGQPALELLHNSLKQTLRNKYKYPLSFYSDFLELSRFSDSNHIIRFFNYLEEKYSETKFELVISLGPGMYPAFEKYGTSLFDSIPAIIWENYILGSESNYLIKGKNNYAVFSDIDINKNIQFALDLKPDTRNIFLVTGISDFDKKIGGLYSPALKNYEIKYNVTYLFGLSVPGLIKRVSQLPEKSIIFFPVYQKDSSGTSYYSREVVKIVSPITNAPIFPLYTSVTENTVGGYLLDLEEIGKSVGEIASNILVGNKLNTPREIHLNHFRYSFDWKQLNKFDIDVKKLPEGSIILNREYTFWETYFYYIISGFVFIVVETILLILLFSLYKKQKNLSRRIIEQDERYRSLVDFNRLTELSELTASLSHELNQPLTAILSSTQAAQRFLLKDKFDRELFDEILANIVEDVKRASGIMNSLRNMIKKDTRVKKHVNLNSLAKDIFHLFYSQAAVRDIKIEAEFDESEPFILADSILIQQVILNLLLNATEALENSTQREKEILLKTEVNDGFVTISVSDNGPGINENLKEEIFKPFFSTKTTGLGIGLAISRSIIEDHDGRIMILNNDTGGATFSFNLKIIQ